MENPHLCVVKVSVEFNEKFSTSFSPETIRRVLREAGLHERFDSKKFFVSEKKKNLRLSFAKSMINKLET